MVDGRPDWPSRAGRRHRSNVCCEWSSKSACCSKVHGSCPAHTLLPDNFTRPSVRTHRGSHPAPSGRPPRGGAKVTWFRYSCEYLGYSRDDPGELIIGGGGGRGGGAGGPTPDPRSVPTRKVEPFRALCCAPWARLGRASRAFGRGIRAATQTDAALCWAVPHGDVRRWWVCVKRIHRSSNIRI